MPRYPHIAIACKAAQLWAVIELYRAVCARRRHGNPDIISIILYWIYKNIYIFIH